MRGALAAAGAGVAAALCCLAIPVTVATIGVSDLVALGTNLGIVAILASALIVVWIIRTRSRGGADASRGGDG
jgi:hypothetical protein